MRNRVIAVFLLLTAVCVVLSGCMPGSALLSEKTTADTGDVISPGGITQDLSGSAVYGKNYAVSRGEYAYFFYEYIYNILDSYTASELSEMGFFSDATTKIKDMKTKNGESWYNVLRDMSKETIRDMLTLCEFAEKENITLDEADREALVSEREQLEERVLNGITINGEKLTFDNFGEFIDFYYGRNVTVSEYSNIQELIAISEKYRRLKYESLEAAVDENAINAYLETEEGERDESLTRNIMVIMLSNDVYPGDRSLEKAQEVLDEFTQSGGGSGEFAVLAGKYSTYDEIEYTNCRDGDLNTKVNDWLFDDARAVGDVEIVTTDMGCCVSYYYSDGEPVYIVEAKAEICENAYNGWLEDAAAEVGISYNDVLLDSIDV